MLPCRRPLALVFVAACASTPPPAPPVANPAPLPPPLARPDEPHLADLRQLTFGGENAEAYWSTDGTELSYQARKGTGDCDRIYRMVLGANPVEKAPVPAPIPVSSGAGATTCSYFLPGDQDLIYASTHLAGAQCPPRPDHSHGYVWALYDGYDIFRTRRDGTGLARLTDTKGYDAEGTVCPKDGSIIFTSVRDGDIDLYRMDADGKNVKRLTNTVGYDGGAFFSRDCTKIVWRASRPKPGPELDEYKALLAKGLVHPTKLELWVADADGGNAQQVTYLGAASFAPSFFPSGKRIIFASNYGDPKGREFDLYAIDVDGTHLERITTAGGFDGFPLFSPDGKYLAFSSNRATPPGQHDTNVFVARWVDGPPPATENAPERVRADVAWLADPARQGRGIGTGGLVAARDWIAKRFADLGLAPDGNDAFAQKFPVTTSVAASPDSALAIAGTKEPAAAWTALGFSASGEVKARAVLAGYGIVEKKLGLDDYAKRDVKGKVVVVRRFVPELPTATAGDGKDPHAAQSFAQTEEARRLGDLRHKAYDAREHGAKALVVVDWPAPPPGAAKDWQAPQEARLPSLEPEGYGDAGIPVVVVTRAALAPVMAKLEARKPVEVSLKLTLAPAQTEADNVVARIVAGAKDKLPGVVLVGAHYDHLGMGGRYSLAPDKHEPHVGADDNASGVAAVLEIARTLAAKKAELRRDVVVTTFSGEESGLLGSTWMSHHAPPGVDMKDVVAMVNLDMVGRLRGNKLSVLGGDTATEWAGLVAPACAAAGVECATSGDGYGPSDQTPFYAAGIPVLFFFTGPHADYHKPSDTVDKINAAGLAKVAAIASDIVFAVDNRDARLTYKALPAPAPRGDQRSFNASLGTIPDYAGPANGQKGVLLAGVRTGGPADKAGLRRGDILVHLGAHAVDSVEDLMYVLTSSKPGETVTATVLRDGKEVKLEATFGEGHH